ncbi:MAG: InlB B-repeat-containing protein [Firmicutes bacterium]|nr:InlB B-repeat-containing protein [Bacillota bacterium]
MKKKLIASITSFALLFTTVFYGMSVPVHATEKASSVEMPEEISNEPVFVRNPETGHIGIEESTIYSRRSAEPEDEISPNTAVPSKYPNVSNPIQYMYNYYPATRSQSPYGTCWAHAATACAEFDMIKNHGRDKYIDYSELQLTYFNYHAGHNPETGYITGNELPGLEKDIIWIPTAQDDPNIKTAKHYLDVGGNMVYSMHTLSQWKGYTNETTLPYHNVKSNKNYTPGNYLNTYHDAAQLRNVRYLDIKNDRDSVKQAIINHGAVYISYYADSNYYNSDTNTYRNTYNTTTNHDIVIVGWDDSKNAWLARNSWKETASDNGSENTYFWLSYYDTSLAATAYSLDFEPYSPSDHLYQHDGVTTHSSLEVNAVSNVFTASSSMPNVSERLDSVMIPFTSATNVNYKIEIYTGLTSSNPTSGHLHSSSTQTGWTTTKGIYTIDLNRPVYLSPREKFSILVTALNGPAYFDFEKSKNVTYKQGDVTYSWFNTTASVDVGESFYYYNGRWIDLKQHGSGYGNACVKAITSDSGVMKYDISYILNGGTNSSANPTQNLSTSSGTFTLKAPTRSGYHFLGWYSDPSYKNKVTYINYGNKSNIALYAKWCSNNNPEKITVIKKATTKANGSYKSYCNTCGQYKGTFTSYKIASTGLDSTKLSYNGSNRSPKPVIKASNGKALINGTDYTYTYNKSKRASTGRYYVTIKFKGRYSADSVKKYFTVVPKAPSTASAVLYGHDDIKVSWSKCIGASGYAVYYKKSTSSKYVLLKRTTSRYVKKANLTDNVKYNFKIVPYYKSGNTRYGALSSKVVSATTLKQLKQPSMVRTSDGRVSLTWQSISTASGYQVYWSAKKKGTYKKLCDYSSKYVGMSFSVGKGKTYYYKTRAYKKVGKTKIYGPWSTPKAFKR